MINVSYAVTSNVITVGVGECLHGFRESQSVRKCQCALSRGISALILKTNTSSLERTMSGVEKDSLSHHHSWREMSPENIRGLCSNSIFTKSYSDIPFHL